MQLQLYTEKFHQSKDQLLNYYNLNQQMYSFVLDLQ